MKHSSLLVLTLLGIILMGAIPAGAASGAGPYYATPSWDQTFPTSTRFIVLTNFNNEAVLDRETGFVWAQHPTQERDWGGATLYCQTQPIGGRYGWRLPTYSELLTLADPSTSTNIDLPAGNPFSYSDNDPGFWTANEADSTYAFVIKFGLAHHADVKMNPKSNQYTVWCIRTSAPQLR
jgi:hypothetical protein